MQPHAFETGFPWSEWEDADTYLTRKKPGPLNILEGPTPFEALLLQSSALLFARDGGFRLTGLLGGGVNGDSHTEHYQRVHFVLDRLRRLGRVAGPKFIFAHIVAPHEPFVFDAEGGFVAADGRTASRPGSTRLDPAQIQYREELVYLNTRIEQLVTEILDDSATPPVIHPPRRSWPPRIDPGTQASNTERIFFAPSGRKATVPGYYTRQFVSTDLRHLLLWELRSDRGHFLLFISYLAL